MISRFTGRARAFAFAVSIAASLPAYSQGIPERVQTLESEVAALQRAQMPVQELLTCGAGRTVNDVLADHAAGTGTLEIVLSGVCTDPIAIARSHVSIVGQAGATVQVPTPGTVFAISVMGNVRDVTIKDLTIIGGNTAGVVVNQGAHAIVRNVTIHGAGSGTMALDNGVLNVTGSTLRNNTQGAYAVRGGLVNIANTTIHNNTTGVIAFKGGNILLTSSDPEISTGGPGPTVRNNVNGVVVRSGGNVELSDTVVENNTNLGILADTGGTVHLFVRLWNTSTGNRIGGHPGAGLQLNKNSNFVASDLSNVITGNGRGIVCHPSTGYVVPVNFATNVTGNSFGDILGCTP
jgi:hypothetical protein